MFTAFVTWLFSTSIGRSVLLAGTLSIGAFATWYFVSSHYEGVGYEKCQNEHRNAQAAANLNQAKANLKNDAISAGIGQRTATDAAQTVKAANAAATTTKETINNAYRDPPKTAPIALGSCVHPLDDRVQRAIDGAVNRSNRTGRSP